MQSNHKKTVNYLRYKLNYSVQQAHSIMAQYGRSIGKEKPKGVVNNNIYYDDLGENIQKDWGSFMNFYGTIKENYPRNRPIQQRHSYDSWWQQNNLNGGFAYNNSSDDF